MSWMEEEMAVAKFKMLRAKKEWIECPALWLKVKFEDKNFKHLTYKDWNHKRNIVNTTTRRHRIRVVLVRKEWFSYAEYLSVMPARKMKGYSNFMGDKI